MDFDLWAAAVDEWVGDDPAARPHKRDWTRMAQLAKELKAVRAYVPRLGYLVRGDAGWMPYLAGFLTAESHLGVFQKSQSSWCARLTVRTRGDELPLLQELRALTGAGSVYHYRPPDLNPVATWSVHSRDDLRHIVSLLDATPLRGRKALEYATWRPVAVSRSVCRSDAGRDAYVRLKQLRHPRFT